MRNKIMLLLVVLGSFLLLFACNERKKKNSIQKAPNVLIILADQWRAQSVGYAGDPNVKTPNIDALAKQSADFRFAVSGNPVCTPYKAALITGQRSLTNGVFMNDVRLDTAALTLAEVLGNNGYNTALIGKWHLDGQYRLRYIPPGPRRQGFQYWKAINCDHNYNHSAYYFDDDTTRHYWKGYDAIAETQDAKKYIVDHAHKDKPFFLMLSWGIPHSPYHTAPEQYRDMYDPAAIQLRPNVPEKMAKKVRYDLAGYYAHISAMDDLVGELVQTLKTEGVLDNTVILVTSDHGDLLGSQGKYKKQRPYEESSRVPMLFYYTGDNAIKSGTYGAMINSEDIMPTLLGLCGVSIPNTVEGVDFSQYIRGKEDDPKDTVAKLVCIQPFGNWPRSKGGKEYRGIRTPNFTYVRDLEGPWLLFDNRHDPYQMDNLVGKPAYEKLQKKLDDVLQQVLKETNDKFLPGPVYVEKYHYPKLDSTGTVPYYYNGKLHL